MHILSRQEMTDIDRYVIDHYEIPGRVLMELAGKGCFDEIGKIVPQAASIAILCGSGNNGGDGFVIARWLKNHHYKPHICLAGSTAKMSPETKSNYLLAEKIDIPITTIDNSLSWDKAKKIIADSRFAVYIDALFGIGFRGSLKGIQKEMVELVNSMRGIKIAIDIASGLDADNGTAETAFRADHTLTMAAPKYGHYLGNGKDYSGEVKVVDMGVPFKVWQEKKPSVSVVDDKSVNFPKRFRSAHKGNYGRVAIIAGSQGYTGAALLSCQAALKSGSGLITLYHPEGLEPIFESCLTEVMTKSIDLSGDFVTSQEFLNNDVLLIGPGLRMSDNTVKLVDMLTEQWQKPAVLDADALNILAANRQWLNRLRDRQFILTPHIGEFARLSGMSIPDISQAPISALQSFVEKYRCSVLLKGVCRIYGDKESIIMDISGNDGLATGGSGDVLAGIIASFLGQHSGLKDAAIAGSFLLGKTAAGCSRHYMVQSITPSMIIENLFKKSCYDPAGTSPCNN